MQDTVVECHSGYTYAERPRAFLWEGRRHVVVAIESEGRTPAGRRFVVRTSDGDIFELVYVEREDLWEVNVL